jgi:hypothetical protein
MSRARFTIAQEIVTPESAERGDAESREMLGAFSLRDALSELHRTRTAYVGGVECIEPDSHPCDRPRWITVVNGPEFETAAQESRALHIPESVTRSSARRIARLAGARL